MPLVSTSNPAAIRYPRLRGISELVTVDLLENFQRMDHLPTRMYLKLGDVWQKPGWSRFLRPLYRDREAARASLAPLRELPVERMQLAHDDPLEGDVAAALRSGFHWL